MNKSLSINGCCNGDRLQYHLCPQLPVYYVGGLLIKSPEFGSFHIILGHQSRELLMVILQGGFSSKLAREVVDVEERLHEFHTVFIFGVRKLHLLRCLWIQEVPDSLQKWKQNLVHHRRDIYLLRLHYIDK